MRNGRYVNEVDAAMGRALTTVNSNAERVIRQTVLRSVGEHDNHVLYPDADD